MADKILGIGMVSVALTIFAAFFGSSSFKGQKAHVVIVTIIILWLIIFLALSLFILGIMMIARG